jgi:DNA-binding transcriptional regulator YiaG
LEKYRRKFGIISPTDLKNLRHHWNFSKEKFAEVLGWNVATIALYEAGAVPSISDNRLLKILIKNPKLMEKFIEDSEKEEL